MVGVPTITKPSRILVTDFRALLQKTSSLTTERFKRFPTAGLVGSGDGAPHKIEAKAG